MHDLSDIPVRIKHVRQQFGKNQHDFADMIGTRYRSLQDNERGRCLPGSATLAGMAASGININWLLTGQGNAFVDSPIRQPNPTIGESEATYNTNTDHVDVTIYDAQASAEHGSTIDKEQALTQISFGCDWVKQEGLDGTQLAAIIAHGDTMEPTIPDGSLLLLDSTQHRASDNSIYIIRKNNYLLIRRLQMTFNNKIRIISDNKAYPVDLVEPEQLDIVAKVVWLGHKI